MFCIVLQDTLGQRVCECVYSTVPRVGELIFPPGLSDRYRVICVTYCMGNGNRVRLTVEPSQDD